MYFIRILSEYLENHPQADIRHYLKNSFTPDFCLLDFLSLSLMSIKFVRTKQEIF